jgi:hypothetical protein
MKTNSEKNNQFEKMKFRICVPQPNSEVLIPIRINKNNFVEVNRKHNQIVYQSRFDPQRILKLDNNLDSVGFNFIYYLIDEGEKIPIRGPVLLHDYRLHHNKSGQIGTCKIPFEKEFLRSLGQELNCTDFLKSVISEKKNFIDLIWEGIKQELEAIGETLTPIDLVPQHLAGDTTEDGVWSRQRISNLAYLDLAPIDDGGLALKISVPPDEAGRSVTVTFGGDSPVVLRWDSKKVGAEETKIATIYPESGIIKILLNGEGGEFGEFHLGTDLSSIFKTEEER